MAVRLDVHRDRKCRSTGNAGLGHSEGVGGESSDACARHSRDQAMRK